LAAQGTITKGLLAAVFIAALALAFNLYFPALSGPFVFDDFTLPYQRAISDAPLSAWLSMAGVRPLLMITYWVNQQLSGNSPTGYHVLNLLIHSINTLLVFSMLHRLLQMASWTESQTKVAAAIGAAVFLVHPLQTESVSYVAGRSESLAAMFVLLAYLAFLHRRDSGITWRNALLVLMLLAAGLSTKENAASLAGILVLTDIFWPVPFSTRNLRDNWRLYALMIPGIVVAGVFILKLLAASSSAGFSLPVTWYQYGFTQARAFFTYLRLAVLPLGQSIDHDFPVSRTVWQYGAIFYLMLLAALCAFLIVRRKRYPLACFGLLMTLIFLAPTSSILPIADPVVERRMYLPLVGLILIGCEIAIHLRISARTGYSIVAILLVVYAALCYQRNQLWGLPSRLWEIAASQSTTNVRPYRNLVDELIQEHRCEQAFPYLQRADQLFPNSDTVQMSWGRVLECVGRRDEALERLQRAAAMKPGSYIYQLIGLLYAEMSNYTEAGVALRKAVALDPKSIGAHNALGLWYESTSNLQAAENEYRTSLALNGNDRAARIGIVRVHEALSKQ
jgi:hypothetical protein